MGWQLPVLIAAIVVVLAVGAVAVARRRASNHPAGDRLDEADEQRQHGRHEMPRGRRARGVAAQADEETASPASVDEPGEAERSEVTEPTDVCEPAGPAESAQPGETADAVDPDGSPDRVRSLYPDLTAPEASSDDLAGSALSGIDAGKFLLGPDDLPTLGTNDRPALPLPRDAVDDADEVPDPPPIESVPHSVTATSSATAPVAEESVAEEPVAEGAGSPGSAPEGEAAPEPAPESSTMAEAAPEGRTAPESSAGTEPASESPAAESPTESPADAAGTGSTPPAGSNGGRAETRPDQSGRTDDATATQRPRQESEEQTPR